MELNEPKSPLFLAYPVCLLVIFWHRWVTAWYSPNAMEKLQLSTDIPYEVGALYNRRQEIHARLGGQMQGGISTPYRSPFVILFTGEAGKQHGYHDFWDDDGVLHYYGEGRNGDMQDKGGNRAIREHQKKKNAYYFFR